MNSSVVNTQTIYLITIIKKNSSVTFAKLLRVDVEQVAGELETSAHQFNFNTGVQRQTGHRSLHFHTGLLTAAASYK